MKQWYVIHHTRRPYAVGPFADHTSAYAYALIDVDSDVLPSDVSIVKVAPKDGKIGRCTVYPPLPID